MEIFRELKKKIFIASTDLGVVVLIVNTLPKIKNRTFAVFTVNSSRQDMPEIFGENW